MTQLFFHEIFTGSCTECSILELAKKRQEKTSRKISSCPDLEEKWPVICLPLVYLLSLAPLTGFVRITPTHPAHTICEHRKTWADSLGHRTKSKHDVESIKGVKTIPIIYILTDLWQMRKASNFRHQITAQRTVDRWITSNWDLKSMIPIRYIREAMEYFSNRLDCSQSHFF